MNKDELTEWFKQSKFICCNGDYDKCSNYWSNSIYEHKGKLYSIGFCNKQPIEKWGEKDYIRRVYELQEVVRKTKMVKEVYYEPVEKLNEKS